MRHTEATKKKLSKMRCGENNPFFGRTHSDETKRRLAEATKRFNLTTRQYDINPLSITIPSGNDLSYLAGMVDADGSIRFRKNRPFLSIYNSCRGLINWLQNTVGGSVQIDKRGREPTYEWTIGATKDVYWLTRSLLPLLIVKREDALAVIEYLEERYGERLQN